MYQLNTCSESFYIAAQSRACLSVAADWGSYVRPTSSFESMYQYAFARHRMFSPENSPLISDRGRRYCALHARVPILSWSWCNPVHRALTEFLHTPPCTSRAINRRVCNDIPSEAQKVCMYVLILNSPAYLHAILYTWPKYLIINALYYWGRAHAWEWEFYPFSWCGSCHWLIWDSVLSAS